MRQITIEELPTCFIAVRRFDVVTKVMRSKDGYWYKQNWVTWDWSKLFDISEDAAIKQYTESDEIFVLETKD